jgi:hypothetical protein
MASSRVEMKESIRREQQAEPRAPWCQKPALRDA